jgi:predicted DNA-binding transcriptional regulator AlpA
MKNLRLLNIKELSALLARSPDTIKKDLQRNPLAVPPRVVIPGTRQLRWRVEDVERWLDTHAQPQQAKAGEGENE